MKIEKFILMPFETNCYIVFDENTLKAAVIDPGTDHPGLTSRIKELGLALEYIFLTHGHYDHVLGVNNLQASTGAKTVIHQADAGCLTVPGKMLGSFLSAGGDHRPADILAREGDTFTVGGLLFKWLHTPGHTVGSSVILCGGVLFTGDTLFAGECGRCDLPGGSFDQMLRSLRRLASLEGDYTVMPGHMEDSTLSAERKKNPYVIQALGL